MRGRKGSTTAWYCDARCHPKPGPNRKPCSRCCGFTVNIRRQAATTTD